jgi:hypothetical protein
MSVAELSSLSTSTVDECQTMFNVKNLLDLHEVAAASVGGNNECRQPTHTRFPPDDCHGSHDINDDDLASADDDEQDNDDVDNDGLGLLPAGHSSATQLTDRGQELDVNDPVYAFCSVSDPGVSGDLPSSGTAPLIYYPSGTSDGVAESDVTFQYNTAPLLPPSSCWMTSNSAAPDYYSNWNGSTTWGQ